jgi:DNA processing protein
MTVSPAWVALSFVVGSKRLRALVEHFGGDLDAIPRADEAQLRQVRGIGPKLASAIRALDVEAVAQAIPGWQEQNIHVLPLDHPDYPKLLRTLDDAPATLFAQGSIPRGRCVAVVGTRSPSSEASDAAKRLGIELASRDIIVVSGLARGIDAAAHLGALAAPKGRTIAVLGCGLLNIYPPEHRGLASAVAQRGALLSEAHPRTETSPPLLVARNRLISGLCEAVIVVETEIDGGAMHAARRAREQGRRVCTLDLKASGNRALIDEGAEVITPELERF